MARLKTPATVHDHWRGDPDAPVVLVEYGDYQCPFCAAAHPIVQALLRSFGPELALVFRHFPMTEVHPLALPAAQAAEFAAERDRFWPMHDRLFASQPRLSLPVILAIGEQLGRPESEVEAALTGGRFVERIREDFLGGARSGVSGTPGFFVNGVRHDGAWSFDELGSAIQAARGRARGAERPGLHP